MTCRHRNLDTPARGIVNRLRQALLAVAILIPAAAAAQTGSVTGTVTDTSTGLPIANAQVSVMTFNLSSVGSATTNASGVYTVSNVPPGALYYVRVSGPLGYVDEIYPDVKTFRNSSSQTLLNEATSISVAGGGSVTGIDFALDMGGSISGTVANAAGGTPVAGVSVSAYTRFGTSTVFAGFANTDAAGAYALMSLPPGTYVLFTSNGAGFQNEIFDNIPCVGSCSQSTATATGTPIPVAAGMTASGRDFALEMGGSISGTVTNAVTGAPVQNVVVQAAIRVGSSTVFSNTAVTDAAGEYMISGLAAGSYGVYTSASNLTNEIYNDILCPLSCFTAAIVDSGMPVNVSLGATTTGIHFALDPGGSITGTVTNEVTGMPAPSVFVGAVVLAGNTTFTRFGFTNAMGVYTIPGLPTGSYALYTSSSTFNDEIFDNIPCSGFCSSFPAASMGTPVPVTAGGTATGRDFALQPLAGGTSGTISGIVTDAASGLPIAGVGVRVLWQLGTGTTSITFNTDVTGAYSIGGLAPGTYFAVTTGNHPFRNEIFDNIPCVSAFCSTSDILTGTPIVITPPGTAATADFGLSRGDGMTGTITDAVSGLPLAGVTVTVYRTSGQFVGSTNTNAAGIFFMRGLPNGTYVAFTSNGLGYRDEIYDGVPCPGFCSPATAIASGTPITVTGAAAYAEGAELVTGISFALDVRTDAPAAPGNLRIVTASSTAMFTWTPPSLFAGSAPTSYLLEAGGSPGTTFITLPIPGTGTSYSVPGVPPGTYYVRLRAVNAFGTGPASNEVLLVVGAGGFGVPEPPTNLFAFMSGGLLTMTWSPPLSGGPPSGYVVEAGSASGAANVATLNVATATFSFTPVPNGFYFLRVRSRNAAGVSAPSQEVMIVVGNVPSPPGQPSLNSPSVSGSTVTLSWQAPSGMPTSYSIEAGSAPGLADLATVNTGSTALTQSFTGVPPGTYYVRIRAVNAQGASVVSNERTIVVS